MTRSVALLGASGYTGRLVAAELARRDIDHRLGGRSAERLAQVPSHGVRHVVDIDDPDSLDRFLDGAEVLEMFQVGLVQGNIPVSVGVLSYAGQAARGLALAALRAVEPGFAAGRAAVAGRAARIRRRRQIRLPDAF